MANQRRIEDYQPPDHKNKEYLFSYFCGFIQYGNYVAIPLSKVNIEYYYYIDKLLQISSSI